jgi:outer membrane protein TolC
MRFADLLGEPDDDGNAPGTSTTGGPGAPASGAGAAPAGASGSFGGALAANGADTSQSDDDLARWWQQFNDGALTALLGAAQDNSSSLAQASANIARARAEAITAGVANAPSLEAIASANRAAPTFTGPLILRTQTQLGLQSSWEIDLFGALARQREAKQASLDASVARWHEARVSLAAEVASAYVSLRHCQLQLQQAAHKVEPGVARRPLQRHGVRRP